MDEKDCWAVIRCYALDLVFCWVLRQKGTKLNITVLTNMKIKVEAEVIIFVLICTIVSFLLLRLILDKPVSFYQGCQPSNHDIQIKKWC